MTATAFRAMVRAATKRGMPGVTEIRVGTRQSGTSGRITANAMLWTDDSDLYEHIELRTLRQPSALDPQDGKLVLDLYLYTGRADERELECNGYLFVDGGRVVAFSTDTMGVPTLAARLGFVGAGWLEA